MKLETTPAFDKDVRCLRREHLQAFLEVLKTKFIPACDAYTSDPATLWPQLLGVKSVQGPAVL